MQVAYGPDGHSVIASETALEDLLRWSREHLLCCPNCRGVVHVRGGAEKRTQLHFAHQRGECAWSTESESVRHAMGKVVLSRWLRTQFPNAVVTLEERLPEPNRIADVFLTHANGKQWAIEFQCAPLNREEWYQRHTAYRTAQIRDIWIIGNNRREKQEAFIEAILATDHELLFLDPLFTPPCVWLRWPVSRETTALWQNSRTWTPRLEGWVGRLGYGATLSSQLAEVRLGEDGQLLHASRTALETRTHLWREMSSATIVDEAALAVYLQGQISENLLRTVLLPLLKAYGRDPDLLRRYNYGRGRVGHSITEAEHVRVQRAGQWLRNLVQRGLTSTEYQMLLKQIPFTGPYASLVGYMEMLWMLLES